MGFRADRYRPSLANAGERHIDADLGQHGFAGDRALAEDHPRRSAGRQVDIDAAAEADQTDALAGFDNIPFLDERQDAPRNKAGDLRKTDTQAVRTLNHEVLPLIVLARLVEVR